MTASNESEKYCASAFRGFERPLERFGRLVSTAAIIIIAIYAIAETVVSVSGYVEPSSRQIDFVAFWSAAELALAGDPGAAFDQSLLRDAQNLSPDAHPDELYWLYPPGFQVLLMPLAMLPFRAAWLFFALTSMIVFISVHWREAARVPMGRNLLIGAPAVMIAAYLGQVSLLYASTLFAALLALGRGRQALAGVLIAVLTLKPQLGILVPVVLLAARRWETFAWATGAMLVLHGLSTLVVGLGYWALLFARMQGVSQGMALGTMPNDLMVTPYAFFRLAGLAHGPALGVQIVLSIVIAAALFDVWRRWGDDRERAFGLLLVAIPIVTPYAFYYELVLTVSGAILLVRAGYGATAFDRILLALLIFGPVVLFPVTEAAPIFAPLIALVFLRAWLGSGQSPGRLAPAAQ